MITSEFKAKARELGADLVGVAPRSRWADLPDRCNPRSVLPACESVIVIGRKILRGAFRGVEEGTNFSSTYHHYGSIWNEFTFLSRIVFSVANFLEESGFEAVPMSGGTPAGDNRTLSAAGIPANVVLDSKELAVMAGLGRIGKGGFLLTPEYGHRQRFGLILTELRLDGDPLDDTDLCQGCQACLQACPLQALHDDGSGRFQLNAKLCALCANGKMPNSPLSGEPLDRLAASCGRACLVASAERIGEKFHHRFRQRAIWERDIHGRPCVKPLPAEGEQA